MTTDDHPVHLHQLREQTIAAVQQRRTLAAAARDSLVEALREDRICWAGADDALRSWGLPPLPVTWTVSGDGVLTYQTTCPGERDAHRQAMQTIPKPCHRLLPDVLITPVEVLSVHRIPDALDGRSYRVSIRVTVRLDAEASDEADAVTAAVAMLTDRRDDLADAEVTLNTSGWGVIDGPNAVAPRLIRTDPPADPDPGWPPDPGDDLAAAITAHTVTTTALADLQHAIRTRAVTALLHGELGGEYQRDAADVDRFLVGLGLPGLPAARQLTVTADMRLRVQAVDGYHAQEAAGRLLRTATANRHSTQPWLAGSRPVGASQPVGDGHWQVCWRHEFEVSLRGDPDPAAACAQAETTVRGWLGERLTGVDAEIVEITTLDDGMGFDPDLS